MKKQFRLTREGIAELEAELKALADERPAIAERIRTARELGDLSENAEYQAARQEQESAEVRIAEIENVLQNATIIDTPKSDAKVQLGSKVALRSEDGKTKEFQVVGTVEANPLEGKISDESPIGKALIGKKENDEVEIVTPAETSTYKIVDIS